MSTTPTDFRERLVPGPGLLGACGALGLLVMIVLLPLAPVAAIAIGTALTVAAVAWPVLGAPVIAVEGGEFCAGRAHVPATLLGDIVVLAGRNQRAEELGAKLDARAHVVLVPSITTGLRVALCDPQDPTPYWLVSTRRPEKLAAALRAAGAGGPADDDLAGPPAPKAVTPPA